MKTDWSNYTITYDGTDYGVYYRDGINLVACETYVPNSPSPTYPATITNTGDLVTSADDDWNTDIEYGKTSFVGSAPGELGVDCYRVTIKITNGEEEESEDYEEQIFNLYLDAPLRYGDTLDNTGVLTRARAVETGVTGATYSPTGAKADGTYLCTQDVTGSMVGGEITFTEAVTGATVEFDLATPTTENITMPSSIPTFEGTTIIMLDTTTQPAVMEAEYWSTEEA